MVYPWNMKPTENGNQRLHKCELHKMVSFLVLFNTFEILYVKHYYCAMLIMIIIIIIRLPVMLYLNVSVSRNFKSSLPVSLTTSVSRFILSHFDVTFLFVSVPNNIMQILNMICTWIYVSMYCCCQGSARKVTSNCQALDLYCRFTFH